ncbi:SRPBCC family protein [Glaciecola sp. XM2]|jgi:uncharacterized protein YndB with AHSA1/START domain|uniref:SRPBCC family protein n=1 Tax=Glaciecola sp. XM2 TaxID=1914931 RepID=UPI001BDE458B|nr:SRPBCC family protein [Glaciecola sp. XM2]MBT1451043.1 SRPBCC family protein [Glaciecola sp. XM2]
MFSICVEREIKKPIDEVFSALADHANYKQFKGIDDSSLLEEGKQEPNGLGALREVVAGSSVLHERIVEFARPTRLAYLIEYSKPLPYEHEFGVITLKDLGESTLVIWKSQGRIKIPLLGPWYFDKQIQNGGGRAFGSILKAIDMR